MKIDRRSFLSFIIGGAAGTALSPLPWKLADDSSIWTQMWPWTPVPEDGEYKYINSVCTLCPGGCGISVRKVDDRCVKIEGKKDFPVNDGGICILGLSGLQLLYGPGRIGTPLKRIGNRGEGKWEKISWDQAVGEVTKHLQTLREKGDAHTVGFISGSGKGTTNQLFKRFLSVYGSPNFMTTASAEDSYEMTLKLMQGVDARVGFDLENSDFILSFGSGLIDGWNSPVRMLRTNSKWRDNKAKVVQVEPRLSNTAAKSDKWIPVRPGTEGILALGLAHVLIKESLYKKEFIDNSAFGFEDWTDESGKSHKGFRTFVTELCSPQIVAKITGIEEAVIVSLAKEFAGASKPVALCGRGQGRNPGSLHEFIAVHALNALAGNINQPGGVFALAQPDYVQWPEAKKDGIAEEGIKKGRFDGAGSERFPHAKSLINRFAADDKKPYALQALFIAEANPLYSLPDSKAVQKAFDNIPFTVSFSSYMDETTRNCDLVLPNHMYLERYEDVIPAGMSKPVVGLSIPVVSPLLNTKHSADVIILMAKDMGEHIADAFPWNNYEECLKTAMGDKWDVLVKGGFAEMNPAPMEYGTSSKKFDMKTCETPGVNDIMALVRIEGDAKAFPLVLIPYDSMRLANGFVGDPPFIIKTVEDTVLKKNDSFIEINPATAKDYDLEQGKYAIVSTPKGDAKVRVHLFEGIMPGVIAMPRGLGHKGDDKYLSGKGINVNELIGASEDPASGLDGAWGIRARVAKA